MNKFKFLSLVLIFGFLLSSCGAKKHRKSNTVSTKTSEHKVKDVKETTTVSKTVTTTEKKALRTIDYVKKYAPIAIIEMQEHKIPASITLAQGILESNSGNSSLTRQSNNHFGIKCHKNWTGSKTYYDDDKKGECFRVYKEPSHSFDDHSEFLSGRKRYQALFKLDPGDYKAWARGLKKAGYATDPKYPDKLIHIIQKYRLYEYDNQVLGRTKKTKVPAEIPEFYIVKKGDGLYRISKKYRLSVSQLIRFNQLNTDQIKVGQKLWLKPGHSTKPITKPDVVAVKQQKLNIEPVVTQKDTLPPLKTDQISLVKLDTIVPIEKKKQDTVKIIVKKEKDRSALVENILKSNTKKDSIPPVIVVDTTGISQKKKVIEKSPDFHIVKKGETLYMIAYKYDLEVPDLRKWNHIHKNEIAIGQKLLLKNPKKVILGKSKVTATHTVAKGDTLYSIATRYKMSVARLKAINGLKNNTIFIGQVLLLK